MKKVKYLLGLSIIGLGLLINQSFAYTLNSIFIDGVVQGDMSSSSTRGANYLYNFMNQGDGRGTGEPKDGFFGYQKYYNGTVQQSYTQIGGQGTCGAGYDVSLGSSIFGYTPFSGGCVDYYNRVAYYHRTNYGPIGYNSNYPSTQVFLGINNSLGKNFVSLYNYDGTSPVYGIGYGFFDDNNYLQLTNISNDYYRLFFNSVHSGNVMMNPLDTLDLSSLNTTQITNSQLQSSFVGWEYFTPKTTRTNFGYVVDDGQNYTKYKHFGLFDFGYSYVYGKVGQSASSLTWSELGFRTVSDAIKTALTVWGDVDYSTMNSLSWDGLLLLRGNSYVSFGNDDGVYILSKNPSNLSNILYEHYSCSLSDIDVMFGSHTGSQSCVKLDGGYLTFNGSRALLPFESSSDTVNIYENNESYPFLYDLIVGGVGSMHGQSNVGSSCLQINGRNCYGFDTDSSVNIKQIYLNNNGGSSGGGSYSGTGSFSYDCVDTQVCRDYTGDNGDVYSICTTKCVSQGSIDSSGNYISQDGTIYYIDSSLDIDNLFNGTDNSYISGFIDDDGMLSLSYYTGLFNSLSDFSIGRCPYPPSDFLGFATKVRIGKFYPFMFLNCWASAFNQGMKVHYFDDFGLFPDLSSQLLQGDTHFHKTLFRFFDILLSLGIILLLSALVRIIKK